MTTNAKNSSNTLVKKFADKFNFPDEKKLIDTLKATGFKIKDGVVTDEQMSALWIVADQYGLHPFTKEILLFLISKLASFLSCLLMVGSHIHSLPTWWAELVCDDVSRFPMQPVSGESVFEVPSVIRSDSTPVGPSTV